MSKIPITQSVNPAGQNVPHPTRENPLEKPLTGDLIDSLVSTVEKAEAANAKH